MRTKASHEELKLICYRLYNCLLRLSVSIVELTLGKMTKFLKAMILLKELQKLLLKHDRPKLRGSTFNTINLCSFSKIGLTKKEMSKWIEAGRGG